MCYLKCRYRAHVWYNLRAERLHLNAPVRAISHIDKPNDEIKFSVVCGRTCYKYYYLPTILKLSNLKFVRKEGGETCLMPIQRKRLIFILRKISHKTFIIIYIIELKNYTCYVHFWSAMCIRYFMWPFNRKVC